MDQLWAPWRLAYITQAKAPAADESCFLCQGQAAGDDRANLIVQRSEQGVVVLNRFPYNNGHLLVAPTLHKGRLEELSPAEVLDTQQLLTRMVAALSALMQPQGFNIGLNLGRVAGAGLPGHLHWHIVPRWNGDTNFMTVLDDTRVISQSLEALYDLLTEQLRKV